MSRIKTTLLADFAVASLAVSGFWYADYPTLRTDAAWVQNQLGIQRETSASTERYLTEPVEEGEIRRIVTATGTLNAIVNVEIGSQLSGQIADVLVDFNDDVKRGQPLARLDQRSFKASVEQARAEVALAEASFASAKAEFQRTQKLRSQQAASVVQLEDASTKLATAEAELRKRKALLQLAEIDLDRTVIRSPINGVIVGRKVNEGETLATSLEAKTLFIVAGDLR